MCAGIFCVNTGVPIKAQFTGKLYSAASPGVSSNKRVDERFWFGIQTWAVFSKMSVTIAPRAFQVIISVAHARGLLRMVAEQRDPKTRGVPPYLSSHPNYLMGMIACGVRAEKRS